MWQASTGVWQAYAGVWQALGKRIVVLGRRGRVKQRSILQGAFKKKKKKKHIFKVLKGSFRG